jgi:hypothetical protein
MFHIFWVCFIVFNLFLLSSSAFYHLGLFEGKTGSLLHPVMMIGMLTLSVSTGLLGFEWRRQRTIGDDISSLKKSLPDLGGASTVSEALTAAKSAETPDLTLLAKLEAALPVDAQIRDLQNERKELVAKGPRDKHYGQGAWLAFIGTCFAIEVCAMNSVPEIESYLKGTLFLHGH